MTTRLRFALAGAALLAFCATPAQWTTTQMPIGQDQLTGIATFDKVYLVGGWDEDLNYIYDLVEYDRASQTWSSPELILNTGRIKVSTVVNGDLLFCAGGWDYLSETSVDEVSIFDLAQHQLLDFQQLSDGRVEMGAAAAGTKVIFAGGMHPSWNGVDYTCVPSNVVDIYDVATQTWSATTLSDARAGMAVASLNGKAYFAGGYHGDGTYSDRVDIYDAATDTWTSATLSQPRAFYGGGVTIGGLVMFAGGITGQEQCSNVVDIHDPASDTWSVAHLSIAREGVQVAVAGHYALFAGGGCGVMNWYYTSGSNAVDIYDADTHAWSTATMSAQRINFLAAGAGDQAFFIGGRNVSTNEVPTVVDIFTDATTAGLPEHQHLAAVPAWPDPFRDHVHLGALELVKGGVAQVFDERGAWVATRNVPADLDLDLSGLPTGLYEVRLFTPDGRPVGSARLQRQD